MRASGVRDVLIYCRDHRCSHHVETNADGWLDDVRLSDIESNFTCTKCGKRGADIRPDSPKLEWLDMLRPYGVEPNGHVWLNSPEHRQDGSGFHQPTPPVKAWASV